MRLTWSSDYFHFCMPHNKILPYAHGLIPHYLFQRYQASLICIQQLQQRRISACKTCQNLFSYTVLNWFVCFCCFPQHPPIQTSSQANGFPASSFDSRQTFPCCRCRPRWRPWVQRVRTMGEYSMGHRVTGLDKESAIGCVIWWVSKTRGKTSTMWDRKT